MQIVVAGQGYVGLPLAARAAEVGHRVVGHDVDSHRVQQLTLGESYVEDVASGRLRAVLDSAAYRPTANAAALPPYDITVTTVPTPLRDGAPDLTYVESCAQALREHLRSGATVVLESTTCPGTTVELVTSSNGSAPATNDAPISTTACSNLPAASYACAACAPHPEAIIQ
ncbi:NAD(P)-binding domain-containing protein [Streptomyces sp. NPDC055886]